MIKYKILVKLLKIVRNKQNKNKILLIIKM